MATIGIIAFVSSMLYFNFGMLTSFFVVLVSSHGQRSHTCLFYFILCVMNDLDECFI